jgi:thioredoxin-related protein
MRSEGMENKKMLWLVLAAALVLLAAFLPARAGGDDRPVTQGDRRSRLAIYDPAADVKTQIAAAVKRAAAGNRDVLLMFGGNWCPWCRRLHELFAADPRIRKVLDERYILLLVDVGEKPGQPLNRDVVDLYRVKDFGYPALAVLDREGKLLCAQSTGVLEKGKGHDPARVLAFLKLQLGE